MTNDSNLQKALKDGDSVASEFSEHPREWAETLGVDIDELMQTAYQRAIRVLIRSRSEETEFRHLPDGEIAVELSPDDQTIVSALQVAWIDGLLAGKRMP